METEEAAFIEHRAQARFLYKRSWYEVGQSVGIDVPCSQQVKDSRTRRKPPQNPPRGYAQRRGGKGVYSIVVYNPFLEEESAYKPFSGKAILAQAMQKHEAQFNEKIAKRQTSIILRLLKTFL